MVDLRGRLRTLIVQNVVGGADVDFRDADNIFELGLVDSMFALDIVELIETALGKQLDDEDLDIDNFGSIDSTVAFYEKKLAGS